MRQLNVLTNPYLLVTGQLATDIYNQVQQAPDLVKTINYVDKDTDNERIVSIVASSAYLAISFTDTYSYEQKVDGKYRIINITRIRS